MRTYELVIVFDSSLKIEQIETDLKKLQDLITREAGFIRVWERWGKRRLAYEIQRRQYGYYTLIVFDVEAELVNELDRIIRLTPAIIRHLITVVDPKRVPEIDEESVQTLGVARPESPAEVSEEGAPGQTKTEGARTTAEEATAEKATGEGASAKEATAEKATGEGASAKEATAEKATGEGASAKEATAGKATEEEASAKEATAEKATGEEASAEESTAEEGSDAAKAESQDKTDDAADEETDKKTEDVA